MQGLYPKRGCLEWKICSYSGYKKFQLKIQNFTAPKIAPNVGFFHPFQCKPSESTLVRTDKIS
jgi:hypothetical protein